MSLKNVDHKGRWRNKTVAFRMASQEATQMDTFVNLSGLTKQDYLIHRVLQKDVIVQGNPRVYKALRNQLESVFAELCQLEAVSPENDELLAVIGFMAKILDGLRGPEKGGE
jgi:hypothetical protein